MALRLIAGLLAAVLAPVAALAVSGAAPSSPGPKELGARHGQALSAARICPGARVTAKVGTMAAGLDAEQRTAFETGSAEVVAGWGKAFACTDVDPAQTREVNGCRKAKILCCTMAWQEIGPEGTALPGLLEFKPGDGTRP